MPMPPMSRIANQIVRVYPPRHILVRVNTGIGQHHSTKCFAAIFAISLYRDAAHPVFRFAIQILKVKGTVGDNLGRP